MMVEFTILASTDLQKIAPQAKPPQEAVAVQFVIFVW
jgi:hypothetical protein